MCTLHPRQHRHSHRQSVCCLSSHSRYHANGCQESMVIEGPNARRHVTHGYWRSHNTEALCTSKLLALWSSTLLVGSEGTWGLLSGSEGTWTLLSGSDGTWGLLSGSEGTWGLLIGSEGTWALLSGSDGTWGLCQYREVPCCQHEVPLGYTSAVVSI